MHSGAPLASSRNPSFPTAADDYNVALNVTDIRERKQAVTASSAARSAGEDDVGAGKVARCSGRSAPKERAEENTWTPGLFLLGAMRVGMYARVSTTLADLREPAH